MHQACKLTIIDDQHNIADTKNLQNNIRILLCTLVIIINKNNKAIFYIRIRFKPSCIQTLLSKRFTNAEHKS